MRPARIVLLLIALIAGGLAAYLATRGPGQQTVVEQVAAPSAPQAQVLVAKQPIGVGERLNADKVEWQSWPNGDVRGEYITSAKSPDAQKEISGAVARFEIFQGEPILDAKLVHTNQGYLSAVLAPGMRGVSVPISAASGSGGFIIPNDRVDVVLTETAAGQSVSRVLLANVKVLAIGTRLGQTGTTGAPADPQDPKSQIFTDSIATLELTPGQADTMINATAQGKISLVLRSVVDFGAVATAGDDKSTTKVDDNSQIKIIRFGKTSSVTPGAPQQPTVNPVVYTPPATTTVTTNSTTPVVVNPAAPAAATPATTTTTTTTAAPAAAAQSGGVQNAPLLPIR